MAIKRLMRRAPISLMVLILAGAAAIGCKNPENRREPEAKPVEAKPVETKPSAAAASTSPVENAPQAPKLARPTRPLNVLFLTVDSLRADMPWAGYSRPIAPNLEKLAAESVVYENHRSVSSYTAQSVVGWLTGRYASTLYREGTFFTGYSKANDFITEALQAKGIRTLGVQAHMYFGRGKGLDQGFDSWEVVKGVTFDATTDKNVTSEKSAERIIELLSDPANTKGQFFLWSHFMDPHDEYKKHPESPDFGNKNRDRYDSEVWYTDYWLGKVIDFAKAQPWWNDTALIVTADHGESFGEHGMYKHAFELWDNLVRVPLIVHAPGAAPRHISEARSHIDIAPTIVDLMGQPPLASFEGKSLVPEIYGAKAEPREAIALELAEDTNNPSRRAIVHEDYKLIEMGKGGPKKLFDLKEDPGELTDISKKEPEKLAEMVALFDKTFEAIPSIEPYGGMKLSSGKIANGPRGPETAKH
jgi:arylsulfatase A-like enzyme